MIVKHIINNKVVWGYRYSYKQDGKWKVKSVRSSKWTKREAEQQEMKFIQSLEKINGDSLKFSELFEMYFDYKKDKLKLRAYRDTRTSSERHILPYFSDMILNDINTHSIEKWQQGLLKATYMKKGINQVYSNRQLEKVQINLNAILSFAFDRELINRNPFKSIGITKRRVFTKEEEKRFITVDEFNRIIKAIEVSEVDEVRKYQDLVTFSILFWCGLRKGELMALDIKDYNFIKKELRISKSYDYVNKIITSPKTTNSIRTVIVPDVVDEYIIKLVSLYQKMIDYNTEYSLISYHERRGANSLTKRKDKYCRIAGLSGITLHSYRHSHVSLLINSGLQPFEIAKRLGHTVEMVNEVYGHLYPSKQKEMVELMNQAS